MNLISDGLHLIVFQLNGLRLNLNLSLKVRKLTSKSRNLL